MTNVEPTREIPPELLCHFDHHDPAQAPIKDRMAAYEELREKCPVAWSDRHDGFWVLTGYAEIERVAKDPGTFSSRNVLVPRDPLMEMMDLPPENLDPPRHTAVRRLLQPAFSSPRVAAFEPAVRARSNDLIDRFIDDGRCDATQAYARSIPFGVMATLLGLPAEDEERLCDWIHRILELGVLNPEDMAVAAGEMFAYLGQQIELRRSQPGEDMVSYLIQSEDEGAKLTEDELLGGLFTLVNAAIDTTWSVIGASLRHLALRPSDRRRLVADASLLPKAVDEFLRYYAPGSMARVLKEDAEVGGVPMRQGDLVFLCFPSGNHDAKVFPDPAMFRLDRAEANKHLAFGIGIHRCLGAGIGRLELRVALEEWLRRIPEFTLVDDSAIEWSTGPIWGPRRGMVLRWDIPRTA